jgi:hypothetical protein
MRYVFLSLFLLIVGGGSFLAIRNGVFKSAEIRIEDQGPFFLLSKEHMGPYHKILPTLEEVEKWAKDNNVACPRTFGEFIDDPNVVETERLRSLVGCELTEKPATIPVGFQFRELPRRKYIVAIFHGSPALGPYKIYGKAQSVRNENGLQPDGSVTEFYKVLPEQGLETQYLFPVK